MAVKENLNIPILILAILYVLSIFYFHFVEGWSYLDAAYFTTATITTVGYGDLVPETDYGKLGAILLSFFGVSIGFYIITHLGYWRERAIDSKIKRQLEVLKYLTMTHRSKTEKIKEKLREDHESEK